ncbi:MAG: ATP-dependent Clp protease proteolytic subunit [Nanoarchaeota archaeon]|nr:ATP-dependent Clp protease proteolytic subunit [Nanoarchaeota archaeon]
MKHKNTRFGSSLPYDAKQKNNNNKVKTNDENGAESCEDDSDDESVISIGNKIYFYSRINSMSILVLNKKIQRIGSDILHFSIEQGIEPFPIFLYINSPGGAVTDGLLGMDIIQNSRVPIHTVIQGEAASAATFLSVVGKKRFMHKNSVMLIHALSQMMYGNYYNLEDEFANCKILMQIMKDIYQKNTKMPLKKIEELLRHDLLLDSKTCLKFGLVDEII